MTKRKPKAPGHLSEAAAAWWRSVVDTYALEDHHLRLLTLACQAWDRGEQARAILATDGITFRDDRENIRAHPAVAIEKDARAAFARLLAALDLDTEMPGDRPATARGR